MEDFHKTLLQEQAKILEKMAEENRILFDSLGISEKDFLEAVRDKRNFTPVIWKKLQEKREELEQLIDDKIKAANTQKENKTTASNTPIKGHWICVK